jgi:quinol-cytochrome oxidoreductase complex cytochrome b subunit
MKVHIDPKKALNVSLTALYLLFALWLVLPFVGKNPGGASPYRLFFGLMLMIVFVGTSLWDVLAPQGLAKKVSSVKAVLLVALAIFVTGFVIFTVAKAVDGYINSAYETDKSNYNTNNNLP